MLQEGRSPAGTFYAAPFVPRVVISQPSGFHDQRDQLLFGIATCVLDFSR
jgi:hypothetical protein